MRAPTASMAALRHPEAMQQDQRGDEAENQRVAHGPMEQGFKGGIGEQRRWGGILQSSQISGLPCPFPGLGVVAGGDDEADDVDQAGDAAKDDAGDADPGLMQATVKPMLRQASR